MEMYLGVMIILMGLCAGSFVNMLVYRTAIKYKLEKIPKSKTQSPNQNRSFCDYCGRQLRWYENIPVVSWLIQSGKTRCCGRRLPLAYPIVEIATGILFLINFQITIFNHSITNYELMNYQNIGVWILGFVILTMLVFETVFDLKYMILPDFGIIIMIGAAVGMMILKGGHMGSPVQYIYAGIGACSFLLFLHVITKGKGMGMGDVKLAAFMGLMLGFPKIIVAFYVAFIVGAVWGIVLMLSKKLKKNSVMPFGPFLILGTIVAWWGGEQIIKFLIFNF